MDQTDRGSKPSHISHRTSSIHPQPVPPAAFASGLNALRTLAASTYVTPYFFAEIYICLGEIDRAVEQLELAVEQQTWFLTQIEVEPFYDDIRGEPRFRRLVETVARVGRV